MTDKNSAPSDNSFPFKTPDGNGAQRHLENVVDELRLVLSDLGRTPKKPDPVNETPPVVDTPSPVNGAPFDSVIPPEEFSPSSLESSANAKANEPVASDADFWNGNVLGWPNSAENDLSDLPLPPNGNALEEALKSSNGELNGVDEIGFKEDFSALEPQPAESVYAASEPEINRFEAALEPLVPEEKNEPQYSSFGPLPTEEVASWAPEDLPDSMPVLPEPPLSPLEKNGVTSEPESIPEPMAANPFSPSFDTFLMDSSGPTEPLPSVPFSPEPTSAFAVPIPQTINRKTEPPSPVPHDPFAENGAGDLKPKGVVQVACIFPEGQEKLGQTFVSKLRETAEKSKKSLNVQAVFVHPWPDGKVDIAAWKKSSVLSGADIMFVLVAKANISKLKELSAHPFEEIRSRVIQLEQVNVKALYTDIVVELQRGK